MSPGPHQTIITVKGGNLESAAAELTTALLAFPNARVVALINDVDRWSSFRGRTTIVAVVQHD